MEYRTFKLRSVDDVGGLVDYLSSLPFDKPLEIQVKEFKLKQTQSQRGLIHKWFDEMRDYELAIGWKPFESLGIDLDVTPKSGLSKVVKRYYEQRFLPSEKTTEDLDTGEMSHFMQLIDAVCAERGIRITIPENSQYYKLQKHQGNKL